MSGCQNPARFLYDQFRSQSTLSERFALSPDPECVSSDGATGASRRGQISRYIFNVFARYFYLYEAFYFERHKEKDIRNLLISRTGYDSAWNICAETSTINQSSSVMKNEWKTMRSHLIAGAGDNVLIPARFHPFFIVAWPNVLRIPQISVSSCSTWSRLKLFVLACVYVMTFDKMRINGFEGSCGPEGGRFFFDATSHSHGALVLLTENCSLSNVKEACSQEERNICWCFHGAKFKLFLSCRLSQQPMNARRARSN